MIKSVLFDLDDTLYRERQFVEQALRVVAADLSGRFKITAAAAYAMMLRQLDQRGRGQVFDRILNKLNAYDAKTVSGLVKLYRGHQPKLKPFSEVTRVLPVLKKRGYKLGLITDGDAQVQRNKVRALGIMELFDCLIFTAELGPGCAKPEPIVYTRALDHLGLAPHQAVYVGDNPYKDFINAKRLGMLTVRVTRGQYKTVELPGARQADLRISTLRGLLAILNNGHGSEQNNY